MNHRFLLGLACFAIALGACTEEDSPPRLDAGTDIRPIDMNVPADAAPDLQQIADVGVDAAVDVGVDAAVDVGVDAAADAGVDAAADVTKAEVTPDGAAEASTPDAAEDAFVPYDTVPACGSTHRADVCFSYCDGVGRFCTGADKQYQTADECLALCNGPTWACGNPSDLTGNSLYCRMTHTIFAGLGAAAARCPNAGPNSPACK